MRLKSKHPKLEVSIFSLMSDLLKTNKVNNLAYGSTNYDCGDELKELVLYYMKKGFNQYAPMGGVASLVKLLSKNIQINHNTYYNPYSELTVTAGATQAISSCIGTFVSLGDEVIIIEPAYESYRPCVERYGGKVIVYKLQAPDWRINWSDFAKNISARTRMIIFNSPHNPSGMRFNEEDFLALQDLLARTDIIVLNDEVYQHMIYDNKQHLSILSFSELRKRSFAVFSLGKSLFATGWKVGYIVGDEILMNEYRKIHQFDVSSVNTPIQHALAEYLSKNDMFSTISKHLQYKRDYFLSLIKNSCFNFVPTNSTYYQLLDYSYVSNENELDFVMKLINEYGVATIPVSSFYNRLDALLNINEL